jgi:hypothetical protein
VLEENVADKIFRESFRECAKTFYSLLYIRVDVKLFRSLLSPYSLTGTFSADRRIGGGSHGITKFENRWPDTFHYILYM